MVVAAARRAGVRPTRTGSTSTGTPRTAGSSAGARATARRGARARATWSSRRRAARRRDGAALLRPRASRCAPGPRACRLAELVAAQHYRLCDWREGGSRLNYRRFFDVTTLAAVRVEDAGGLRRTPTGCCSSCSAPARSTASGSTTPTGWPTRAATSRRLADATDDAWVVAEKILEGHEQLPDDWRCAGTTGYDTLLRVRQALRRPGRRSGPLTDLLDRASGAAAGPSSEVVTAKQQVVAQVQAAEVNRLMRAASTRSLARRRDRPPCAERARCPAGRDGPLPRLPRPGRTPTTPRPVRRRRGGRGRASGSLATRTTDARRRRALAPGRPPPGARRPDAASASSSCGSSRPADR